jgi:hypothetical protein
MAQISALSFSSKGEPMPLSKKIDLQPLLTSSLPEPLAVAERRASSPVRPGPAARQHNGSRLVMAIGMTALVLASLPGPLFAQSSTTQNPPSEPEGVTSGGYVVHSSGEVGYRSTDVSGSGAMYDTLVNLQSGPRLLDETLSMQSADHQGILFDNLYLSSFGWGGDPNNVLRMRVDKNKWYNFVGTFRRDQYFSDYDLLANPLNPPTSTPSIPALNSPGLFDTTRRMTDVDITIAPQSRASFRLGFSHNNMNGPVYTSVHEGTDAQLVQGWNTTMNSYRLGVDLRRLPRTVLSYDQFLDYYKGDTGTQLASFAPALLSNGVPVELGLPIDTKNSIPCAVKPPATSLINSSGVLTNSNCNAYFSYLRDQRIRTSTPTERLSLRSNYFRRMDFVGSYSYSSADSTTPLDESFNGLLSRTFTRAFTGTGTADARRISNVLDLEATLHLTRHLRLIEKFYFWAYRIPQNGNFNEIDSVCNVHATCTLLTALTATSPTAVPTLTLSSFNQTWKRNQTDLVWDITKKAGARIGFRYGNQLFNDVADYSPGDATPITVHEYTGLLGLWARPTHNLRLNFDMEHTNNDNVIVRIAPRKESRYRFQTSYTPKPWAVLGGSINILEDANDAFLTNYVGHNRNYGLTASMNPRARFGVDLAYNYNNVIQNATICFNDTPPVGVSLPFVTNATSCAAFETANPLLGNSYYNNETNFGMSTIRFKPEKRVTANLGYSITSVEGRIPQFNILQPLGTTQYKYQQPVANLSVDIGHKLAFNMGWNYYQYNEGSAIQGSFVGPTAPRYFHANNLTESLRYAF